MESHTCLGKFPACDKISSRFCAVIGGHGGSKSLKVLLLLTRQSRVLSETRKQGHHYRNKNNIIRPSIALRTLDAISCRWKTPRTGDKSIFPIIPFRNNTRLVDRINRKSKSWLYFRCPLQPFNTQARTISRNKAQNSPRHTNTSLKAVDN